MVKSNIFSLTGFNREFAKQKSHQTLTVASTRLMALRGDKGRQPFESPALLAHLP